MARQLRFSVGDAELAATPVKVERSKLYGRTETVALDDEGRECELVLVDSTGTFVIPRGGTGTGSLTEDGVWIDRSLLVYRGQDGRPLDNRPSSFDAPVPLTAKGDPEDLLDTTVTAVYQLADADEALLAAVGDDLYSFEYFYRSGPSGSQAFLLAANGSLFLLIGSANPFPLIGLDAGADSLELDDDAEPELDDLDFSMI